jgi:hypothetical protein
VTASARAFFGCVVDFDCSMAVASVAASSDGSSVTATVSPARKCSESTVMKKWPQRSPM